jgi:hypothetical protein
LGGCRVSKEVQVGELDGRTAIATDHATLIGHAVVQHAVDRFYAVLGNIRSRGEDGFTVADAVEEELTTVVAGEVDVDIRPPFDDRILHEVPSGEITQAVLADWERVS